MVIRIKLKEILSNKGISQKELKKMIDKKYYNGEDKFRTATISEIYNNQRKSINKNHLEMIYNTLELKSMDELIEVIEE
ncbi:helix-turn-helix domain-containing protein [Tenuibacillus multivorans]|uniref:Cro/C1-type HTH DNA-binding domain-containing protein n=1 Tax=Tenuibacillus multivorans TaxID=237069 RepID=A0A1G9XSJ7_9BACI|nr:helix-turn-helix domain-containing protein [Tenuibacillus multivorans]GEL75788.1 hypothetical protein TMU01_00230 [Tenuibacillus multivorans]SDM99386.1 Cro/C1-type HTH DNA-binding domain-containing protein [Tenuibacillus multivorans]